MAGPILGTLVAALFITVVSQAEALRDIADVEAARSQEIADLAADVEAAREESEKARELSALLTQQVAALAEQVRQLGGTPVVTSPTTRPPTTVAPSPTTTSTATTAQPTTTTSRCVANLLGVCIP